MLAMILTMSVGFGVTVYAYDEEEITYIAEQYVSNWNSTDFQQYIDTGSLDDQTLEQFTSWQNLKNEIGKYDSITDTAVEEKDGTIYVKETVKFEKGSVILTVCFDKTIADTNAYNAVTQVTVEKAETGGNASLTDAAANTLMGMGTVFIILIFISFLISLLKFVPKLLQKKEVEKKEEIGVSTTSNVIGKEQEELSNDKELVAVITAAIMASMEEEAPEDGLIVRSIRRRH